MVTCYHLDIASEWLSHYIVLQTLPNQAYTSSAMHINWLQVEITAYLFIWHRGRGTL